MISPDQMAGLLEAHLRTVSPKLPLAIADAPLADDVDQDQLYMRAWVLFSEANDYHVAGGIGRTIGTFQVNTYGLRSVGDGPVLRHAGYIRDAFVPPLKLTTAGGFVKIARTGMLAPGYSDGDRWIRPISIRFTDR